MAEQDVEESLSDVPDKTKNASPKNGKFEQSKTVGFKRQMTTKVPPKGVDYGSEKMVLGIEAKNSGRTRAEIFVSKSGEELESAWERGDEIGIP